MPNPDPPQPHRGQLPASPERAFRSLLAADARPAIRAASGQQLRSVLTGVTSHLCRRVHRQASDFMAAAPAPDRWPGACEAGSGMRAGFQLYDDLCRTIAADWLHTAGFDPAQAAVGPDYHATVIDPFLAAAGKHRLRGALLTLTDRVRAVTADATPAPPSPLPPGSPTTYGTPGPASPPRSRCTSTPSSSKRPR